MRALLLFFALIGSASAQQVNVAPYIGDATTSVVGAFGTELINCRATVAALQAQLATKSTQTKPVEGAPTAGDMTRLTAEKDRLFARLVHFTRAYDILQQLDVSDAGDSVKAALAAAAAEVKLAQTDAPADAVPPPPSTTP